MGGSAQFKVGFFPLVRRHAAEEWSGWRLPSAFGAALGGRMPIRNASLEIRIPGASDCDEEKSVGSTASSALRRFQRLESGTSLMGMQ